MTNNVSIQEPLDLVRLHLNEKVHVKLRDDRELKGVLHAYDEHMNMILSGVKETITRIEIAEKGHEEMIKTEEREMDLLFIRGDSVIAVIV